MALKIPKVRVAREAHDLSIKIHLFRSPRGELCGWYVGPIAICENKVHMPYLPRSAETRATVAVMRAVAAANEARTALCLVDPDDLWEPAWRAA